MSLGNCQLSTVTPGIDDMNMCPCHCPCHSVPMSFAIMLHFANMFPKSDICYLLFAPQKNRFQKLLYCYIVTLGDGVIDLSCDIIKIKLKKFGTYRYYSYICNVNNCNYC